MTFANFISELIPPSQILGPADAADVDERREHIEKLLAAVSSHITALLTDLNQHLPVTQTVDSGDFANGLHDLFGDAIGGSLERIADRLEADEYEFAHEPRGSMRAGDRS